MSQRATFGIHSTGGERSRITVYFSLSSLLRSFALRRLIERPRR